MDKQPKLVVVGALNGRAFIEVEGQQQPTSFRRAVEELREGIQESLPNKEFHARLRENLLARVSEWFEECMKQPHSDMPQNTLKLEAVKSYASNGNDEMLSVLVTEERAEELI